METYQLHHDLMHVTVLKRNVYVLNQDARFPSCIFMLFHAETLQDRIQIQHICSVYELYIVHNVFSVMIGRV